MKSLKFLVVGFCLILTACGFHLRGYDIKPKWLNHIYVECPGDFFYLKNIINTQFEDNGIIIAQARANASYILVINAEYFNTNVSSVSSSTTPRIYKLGYHLQFKLIKADGTEIVKVSDVESTRQVTINNNRILGSNYEETLIKNEMRKEAVIRLINRIK